MNFEADLNLRMRHLLFSDIHVLQAQTKLPEIKFSLSGRTVGNDVAFITGATGFIGGYLMRSLIRKGVFKKYICLVRCEMSLDGLSRLKKSLIQKGLDEQSLETSNVEVLCGDILAPNFGLSQSQYDQLCQEVDHFYHFAATMNWVTPFNQNTLENLGALRQVIECCAQGNRKQLHYASSMGLWTILQHESDTLLEDSLHPFGDQLAGGYFQSKWVAEKMLQKARNSGMSINIYRIGDVKGSSEDGQGDANNFGNLVMHYFIKTGLVIDKATPEFNFIPVDYLASSIAHISTTQCNGNYQFTNSELISFLDIADTLENEGFKVNHMSMDTWQEHLRNDKSILGRTLNAIFREFNPGGSWPATSFYKIGVDMFTKKHDITNTLAATENTGITTPAMKSNGTLAKYLHHLSTLNHEPK